MGLGVWSVSGLMRSPRPAAKTMAVARVSADVPRQSFAADGSKLESKVFKRIPLCCHGVGLAGTLGQ